MKINKNDNNRADRSRLAKVHQAMHTFLPEDFITNILLRLPTRSIARFKSVCKQWHSFVNDSYFLNERHNRSLNQICIVRKNVNHKQIVFYNFDRESTKHHLSFLGIDLGCSPHYYLSNIVNGLTCAFDFSRSVDMHLLNLDKFVDQKSKLSRNIFPERMASGDFNRVGLGFDMSKGAYKVVKLFAKLVGNYSCAIMTLGSLDDGQRRKLDDSQWRLVGEAPAADCTYEPVFLHGALHWKPRYETDPLALIKFDVESEKFEVMKPTPHNCPRLIFLGFSELENCICSCFWTKASEVDIWILKNYKKCEWCKIHSINVPSRLSTYSPYLIGIADGIVMLNLREVGMDEWTVHCFDIRDEVYYNLMSSN